MKRLKLLNDPSLSESESVEFLEEIAAYKYIDREGESVGLLTSKEIDALSIRYGTLTHQERKEIEMHVVYTKKFLEELPWPKELAQIPLIAGAHHEKLDGSGYPEGLASHEIPLPTKVMTVCDIFDAVTAFDRPYREAISKEKAIEILYAEADRGYLDHSIVEIFQKSESYQLDGEIQNECRFSVNG